VCTPTCLLAASISVEAVTPPLVGLACKELPLFCGETRRKSNDHGSCRRYASSLRTGVRGAVHDGNGSRNELGWIAGRACRYGDGTTRRNLDRRQVTNRDGASRRLRGKRAARSHGRTRKQNTAVMGIVRHGGCDSSVSASVDRRGRLKVRAEGNGNRSALGGISA